MGRDAANSRGPRQGAAGPAGRPDSARGPRPSTGKGRSPASEASPKRRELEQRSAPLLGALIRAPRWLLPIVLVALLLAGLAAPPILGGAALLALVAVLTWLAFLSWPGISSRGRLLRAAAIALLLALALARLFGVGRFG